MCGESYEAREARWAAEDEAAERERVSAQADAELKAAAAEFEAAVEALVSDADDSALEKLLDEAEAEAEAEAERESVPVRVRQARTNS